MSEGETRGWKSMTLIESGYPAGWHDLQAKVHKILTECGMKAEMEHSVGLARGTVEVDVYAEDAVPTPPAVYFCECKNWITAIPQSVVHAFRNVVIDGGANIGLIISRAGFQSGARQLAAYSNIRLLTWEEFQRLFRERWVQQFMLPTLGREGDPLLEYTEPINGRIARKAARLSPDGEKRFRQLQERWQFLGMGFARLFNARAVAELPLRTSMPQIAHQNVPNMVLDATSLRALMEALIPEYYAAIAEFDHVFGGRA